MKKDSICQVDVINQQNVTTATNYLEKEKVQKSLRILSKFTDNKQINIIFYLLAVEELCVGKIIYYFIKDEEIRDFFNQLG
ncbi:MAG: transcriptional regulator [Streptococcus sp.]|uniref:transcriptional regulator n=1 Tax=Streptococcus sp. TaxID=1306 RepID=UPI002904AF1C|nr:transcriptional regulator [Streptococcus sp.]MDU3070917.1 transcriptional regulator [Streptococcus sp.]